jgi:hypothetical protein
MRFFFIVLLLCFSFADSPTVDTTVPVTVEAGKPGEEEDGIIICEVPAQPTVDFDRWKNYLNDRLELDSAALDTIPAGRYTVWVRFTVGVNGQPDIVNILTDPGYGLGKRVSTVITDCRGLWKYPFADKNEAMVSYHQQPITFIIEKEEICENKVAPGHTL